jgi:ribonucleoside-diphosphate reductase alpha chain
MKGILDYFNGNEIAANVWQNKYQAEGEITPDDMHKRLAKEFARMEEKFQKISTAELQPPDWNNLSDYGRHRDELTEEAIYQLFKDFKYIVPQGSVMQLLGNNSKIGSLSNCFVIGQPEDSYGGIMNKDEQLVQLMKRRGGVGLDISTLRPRFTKVNNAAVTSSGAASFAERFSNSTREVAQDGRRGALMLSMRVEHPDIEEFIEMKQDLTKVTGANISVMLTNEFMQAVEEDQEFMLKFPVGDYTINIPDQGVNDVYLGTNTSMFKKVKARDIWGKLIKAAHTTAEPGVMFIDNHWNFSPDSVYPQFKGITTNPCGEIFMGEYDACRLMVLNFYSFVEKPFTKEASFDFDTFYKVAYEQQILADDLVELELEAISRIINHINGSKGSYNYNEALVWREIYATALSGRRTGSGFTGLGDALAAMGIRYDSVGSMELTDKIMKIKMEAELDATIDMAIKRGAFRKNNPASEYEIEGDLNNIDNYQGLNLFYVNLKYNFPEQVKRMYKFGRRNVSWSTVSPTGSVSILTETTSGIEPVFNLFYTRRKKINANDLVSRVDFTDNMGDKFQEFTVIHPKLQEWYNVTHTDGKILSELSIPELEAIIKDSPWVIANDINYKERILLQAIIQQYTTHSISSTINLPKDISPEVIGDIYMLAYKSNLKGITVYREGSRAGILINKPKDEDFKTVNAPQRGNVLSANLHFTTARGDNFIIIVGLKNGKPYEIFAFNDKIKISAVIPGKVTKVKRGVYTFLSDDHKYSVENIVTEMDIEQKATTLYVSMLLRHGTPIPHITKTMKKVSDNISSLTSAMIRILNKYVPDGEESAEVCSCGAKFVYESGCKTCKSCGAGEC